MRRAARIAVVEDDAPTREALVALLSDEGYDVLAFRDGRNALEALEDTTVDVVLSDVRMPGTDGLGLVAALRERPATREVPILLVSALDDGGRRVTALDLGADDYIAKPVDPDELLARIRVHMRHLERQRELERGCLVDEATGVLNRRGVLQALGDELARSQRHGHSVAVLAIDLDDFKEINDCCGHAAGDAVLEDTARRIASAARRSDRVGRMGGDEFLVVLADCDADTLDEIVERIRVAIAAPISLPEGSRIELGASIGAARMRPDDTERQLVDRADRRMYADKRARKQAGYHVSSVW